VPELSTNSLNYPVIPVTLYQDGAGEWKKRPLARWDAATTDPGVVDGWWRVWPDALPGIPLRLTDLVVVDADSPEAVAEMRALRMLGPHSTIATPRGGLHRVFAQPPERIGKLRWSEGIEILGSSCLLTVYDPEELRFPRVAPRAVLPEMFWKPKAECGWRVEDGFMVRALVGEAPVRVPINKAGAVRTHTDVAHRADVARRDVVGLTDALFALDPVDWRGCHDEWLSLMNAAKWLGIAEDDFVGWSLGDPVYAADERVIRRKWRSLNPAHGGALYAALSGAGIKVAGAKRSLIDGHPHCSQPASHRPGLSQPTPRHAPQPTRSRYRFNSLLDALERKQDPDMLFWVACRVGEMMIELGRPKPSDARDLLVGYCPDLVREIGADEVDRIITNGFHQVEKEVLEEPAAEMVSSGRFTGE
jgi:hypothetical protein